MPQSEAAYVARRALMRARAALRRRFSHGFSKCRFARMSRMMPSRSSFFFRRRRAFSTDSPFLILTSVVTKTNHLLSWIFPAFAGFVEPTGPTGKLLRTIPHPLRRVNRFPGMKKNVSFVCLTERAAGGVLRAAGDSHFHRVPPQTARHACCSHGVELGGASTPCEPFPFRPSMRLARRARPTKPGGYAIPEPLEGRRWSST